MKQLVPFVLAAVVFWAIESCEKPDNNDPYLPPTNDSTINTPPLGNPSTSKPDSILLLTKIQASGGGQSLQFEYDSQNRLTKVLKPFNNAPSIVSDIYYQNGRISTIISNDGTNIGDRASAIFYYDTANRYNKVVFKKARCCLTNENLYWHTVTDSNDVDSYVRLIYNSNGQLMLFNQYGVGGNLARSINYTYKNNTDTMPSQVETGSYGARITTNNKEHPGLKQMGYFPFLGVTTLLAGTANFVRPPIIFDDRQEYIERYLSFFSKCITSYTPKEDGKWSYWASDILYSFSKDSLTFQASIPTPWPGSVAKFIFKKVKK